MLVKQELDAILDTFTAADGGISLIGLKSFLETVSVDAMAGVPSAHAVLDVVRRFHKLICIANKD